MPVLQEVAAGRRWIRAAERPGRRDTAERYHEGTRWGKHSITPALQWALLGLWVLLYTVVWVRVEALESQQTGARGR